MQTLFSAGKLDPVYASQGRFSHPEYDHLGPIAIIESTQKTLVSSAPRNAPAIKLLRLEPDGTLDLEFGSQGVAKVEYEGARRVFLSEIITDEAGRIFVLGDYNYAPDSYHPIVVRLLANGEPDTHFGEGGKPYRVYRSVSSTVKARSIDSASTMKPSTSSAHGNGGAGIRNGVLYFRSREHIVAIELEGDLATDFNGTGYWRAAHDNEPVLLGALSLNEQGIYAAYAPLPTEDVQNHVIVTRLNEHAKVDKTFADGGYLELRTPDHTLLPVLLKQSASNHHFVLACRTDINTYGEGTALMSFNSDGMLNDGFNEGRPVIVDKAPLAMASALDLSFDTGSGDAEKIYLAVLYENEKFESHFVTLRFHSNGEPDRDYGADGRAFVGERGMASWISCQRNGQPLVACNLRLPTDTKTGLYVARLGA
ncbi:delta-60 repeat domain-containing protein [Pseudomonas sp. BN607]|uniref:delta-60 repeat domain-containing protein n=1 Tax=Pseudomonas sp. BN607 TaxID=2567895 RepID=UPI00245639C0|nr:delta-60 repeat domain-containing protein [Pseudomonas sp. BN607]MDH4551510.1 hypothetical protein [Pseudomonas sp. BN607]